MSNCGTWYDGGRIQLREAAVRRGRPVKTGNAGERVNLPRLGDGKAQQRQARQNEKRLGTGTSAAARRQEGAAAIKRRKERQKCTISIRLQTGGGRIR